MLKKTFLSLFVLLSIWGIGCDNNPDVSDLTTNIVGVYEGTLTINLSTDSAEDLTGQRIEIQRIDDETVSILPITYPDSSPVDTLELVGLLTQTPYSFIQTKGVMLTIEETTYQKGTVSGTPYSLTLGTERQEDGKYDEETGELIFALQIFIDGKDHYELFQGTRQ